MARQQVQTNNLLENVSGKTTRPQMATNSLSPSAGSVIQSPPKVTQLVGVDFQLSTSIQAAYVAGNYYLITFPPVGFSGILSAAQKVLGGYSVTTTTGSQQNTPITTNFANNISPLVCGQTTQLLLCCQVQTFNPQGDFTFSNWNLATQAIENQMSVALIGPWFPSGTTYLGFSCLPTAIALCTISQAAWSFTVGITAQLYAIFNQ